MELSRRAVLRGGGATLTLPMMDSLIWADKASSSISAPTKKLAIIYLPNGIVRRCFFPGEEEAESVARQVARAAALRQHET